MNVMKSIGFFIVFSTFTAVLAVAAPIESSSNTSLADASKATPSPVLGFKEWKKNQVFDARLSLDKFKSPQLSKEAEGQESTNNGDDNVDNSGENPQKPLNSVDNELEQSLPSPAPASESKQASDEAEKLMQLEFNLEIARGLTIHDYFALYLKNMSREDMAKAIEKLSPDELSELLIAYKKTLYGAPKVEVKATESSSKQL